ATDQRGFIRPQGSGCDIGAYEFGAVSPTPTNTPTVTATPTQVVTPTPTTCGNGVLDPGEQCDDGNQTAGDSCPANCSYTAAHVLVRGDSTNPVRDARSCQVEWYVANPDNPPDHFGLPNRRQTCTDQDPRCDISGFDTNGNSTPDLTPGLCRFQVVV